MFLMKKPSDILTYLLRTVLLRRRLHHGVFAAGAFLAVGTCTAFVLLITGFSPQTLFIPPVFFCFGFLVGILFPVSLRKTAGLIDERLGLSGRVMTAFEIGTGDSYAEPVVRVQREDACRKISELLSAEPDILTRTFPLDFRSLFWSFLFFLSFAAILFTIPADRLQIVGRRSALSSSPVEAKAPESAEEVLARTESVIEEVAEENPQMISVRELKERVGKIPSLHESGMSAVFVLREWESALAEAIEELVADDVPQTLAGGASPNSDFSETRAAVASRLRAEWGRIIDCRLNMTETLSQNGGEGTADPGKSRNTWGRGDGEARAHRDSDEDGLYEGAVDLAISGRGDIENVTADSSDPNDLSSIPGYSVRTAEPVSPPSIDVPEHPVIRDVIPPEREELVKRYFDY